MSEKSASSISFVIVSFNSEATLSRALISLPDQADVVVVEQSASGSAAAVVSKCRPRTRVIRAGANRGFGAGCNLGAANALGDVLVFLNPDAELAEGSWEALANEVAVRGGGIVGPRILDASGEDITRARNWTTALRRSLDLLLPRAAQPRTHALDVPDDDIRYLEGGEFDYLQGACLAVGRSVFFAAGGFCERLFLYGEEEWLAEQVLRATGIRCFLTTTISIQHVGATSTDAVADFATAQMYRSAVLSERLRSGHKAALMAALLLWASLLALAITTPVRSAVGFRKEQRYQWCAHAAYGVWQGLCERAVVPPSSARLIEHWKRDG